MQGLPLHRALVAPPTVAEGKRDYVLRGIEMPTSEKREIDQNETSSKRAHPKVGILNFGCSVFVRGYKVATSRVAGL